MRGGGEDLCDVVLVAQLRPGDAAATATLRAERVGRHRLHVALGRQRDDEVFVVDQVFDVDVAGVEGDLAPALCGELASDLRELVLDHGVELLRAVEDRLELGDRLAQLGHLGIELVLAEAGELVQPHVEDVLGLHLGELERLGHERILGRRSVGRLADGGDDLVDHAERLDQTFDDVRPTLRLVEAELRTPADDFDCW